MAMDTQTASVAVEMQRAADMSAALKSSCWVITCCVHGYGCAGPTPVCQDQTKLFCCRNRMTSGEECCGPLGCCSMVQKILCCIHHAGGPMKCALCNAFVYGGKPEASGMLGADEAQEVALLQNTFWCYYCPCIGGSGLTSLSPLVKGRSKTCCVMWEAETADCAGPEGCWIGFSKILCLTQYVSCPPKMTPGIGLCGIKVCESLGDERDVMVAAAPPVQQQMDISRMSHQK